MGSVSGLDALRWRLSGDASPLHFDEQSAVPAQSSLSLALSPPPPPPPSLSLYPSARLLCACRPVAQTSVSLPPLLLSVRIP